jgi:uncharacterized protein with gpF-like domain
VARLIDQDRAREARRQGVLLDRLARQFENRLAQEIEAASREMLEGWKLTREVIQARGFRERLEAIYRQMIVASVTAFGQRIWDQGKSAGFDVETKRFPGTQDFAQFMLMEAMRYLAREVVRQRIGGVEMETRANILRAIARGYVDGLAEDGIAEKILEVIPAISKARARIIARTETHGAANYGSLQAAMATGLDMNKEWLSAADERTRQTHVEADGQTVGIEENFRIGSAFMAYPGDPQGPAEEVINCRCTLAYLVKQ